MFDIILNEIFNFLSSRIIFHIFSRIRRNMTNADLAIVQIVWLQFYMSKHMFALVSKISSAMFVDEIKNVRRIWISIQLSRLPMFTNKSFELHKLMKFEFKFSLPFNSVFALFSSLWYDVSRGSLGERCWRHAA